MTSLINEFDLEQEAIDQLVELGYQDYRSNDYNKPNKSLNLERKNNSKIVILKDRLKNSLIINNKNIDDETIIDEALHQFETLASTPSLMDNNHMLHKLLVEGAKVTRSVKGSSHTYTLYAIDFKNYNNNDFIVTNQFTVRQGDHERRPDITLFINGLPLVTFELKNPVDKNVSTEDAYNQLQTYKSEISEYLGYNEILIVSDGFKSKSGSLTAGYDHFKEWRAPKDVKDKSSWEQETLIRYMLNPSTLLDIIQNFIIFENDFDKYNKILAAYHQYYMVNNAVNSAQIALSSNDKKIGVVWHTQGSGKSLSMVFFTGIASRKLGNPTFVVVNDRNDLDDQLSNTFSEASEYLGQKVNQANDRKNMRKLLSNNSGGIIFTTIQKFMPDEKNGETKMPILTDRQNVIVMVDEAHRSQYGLNAKYDKDSGIHFGFAKYLREALPNASFIGFTGTPIDLGDKSTIGVFGNYIDVYDMTQSVKDHTTVKIYYDSHIIPLTTDKNTQSKYEKLMNEAGIDESDMDDNQRRNQQITKLQSIAGAQKRMDAIAKHFVNHFESREKSIYGKSMIVESSRQNAVKLFNSIIKLRPKWSSDDINNGKIKVIMTSSASDGPELAKHHTNKSQRTILQRRMKENKPGDPNDLEIVIVVDMWLTGFDAPALNTMYIDKPMQGHNLMQAIARVNRVFKDKDSGLLVDYIGIASTLKEALKKYSEDDKQQTGINVQKAIEVMNEKYNIIRNDFLNGIDYSKYNSKNHNLRINTLRIVLNSLFKESKENIKSFCDNVQALRKASSLVSSTSEAQKIAPEVAFFTLLKSSIQKINSNSDNDIKMSNSDINYRLRQLMDQSILPEKSQDLYKALGLERPEISILSDQFLKDMQKIPEKNLAVALLEKLLKGKVKSISKTNIVKAQKFSEMLKNSVDSYNARGITTEIVIRQLIDLAKHIKQDEQNGKKLGLSEEEQAFYSALSDHDKAIQELGEEKLHELAKRLVNKVKDTVGTDWVARANIRAKMRIEVRKLLREYGYPPDFTKEATNTVVKQAEQLALNLND